jgi:hypothetical protein
VPRQPRPLLLWYQCAAPTRCQLVPRTRTPSVIVARQQIYITEVIPVLDKPLDFVALLQAAIAEGRVPAFRVPLPPTPYFGYGVCDVVAV